MRPETAELLYINENGLCRGENPELFFAARGESDAEPRAICQACPVRGECADWGIRHEKFGMWGGLSERQRRRQRRARNIRLVDPDDPTLEDLAS